MQILKNKKAIITGGTNGIGRAIARTYARAGADIVVSYRQDEAAALALAAEIKQNYETSFKAIKADMANQAEVENLAIEAIEFLGEVNILVNNAGSLTRHKHNLDIPIAELRQVLEINLVSVFNLTQLIARQMIKQAKGGSIINITSVSAKLHDNIAGLAHYEISKAAADRLTTAFANALADYRIRVNAIAPGLIATNINKVQREKTQNYGSAE